MRNLVDRSVREQHASIGRKAISSLELFDACRKRVENTDLKVNAMMAPGTKSLADLVPAGAPATRHALAQLDDDRKQDFVSDVEKILEPYAGPGELRLPTRSHIVIAEP